MSLLKKFIEYVRIKNTINISENLLACGVEQEDIEIVNLFTLLKLANNMMKKETSSLILMAI